MLFTDTGSCKWQRCVFLSEKRRHGKIVDQSQWKNIALLRVRGKEREGAINRQTKFWRGSLAKNSSKGTKFDINNIELNGSKDWSPLLFKPCPTNKRWNMIPRYNFVLYNITELGVGLELNGKVINFDNL